MVLALQEHLHQIGPSGTTGRQQGFQLGLPGPIQLEALLAAAGIIRNRYRGRSWGCNWGCNWRRGWGCDWGGFWNHWG